MSKKINVNELAVTIQLSLQKYSQEVAEGLKEETRKVAKKTVKRLKDTSPKRTGEYAKGWTSKVEYEGADEIRIKVRNRKKPQLTQLLENGHKIKIGGQVKGGVKAYPHIRQAEEDAKKELLSKVEEIVK